MWQYDRKKEDHEKHQNQLLFLYTAATYRMLICSKEI